MKIKKIKFIDNIEILNKYDKYAHVYLGSEFCEKKLFTLKDLKNIVAKNSKQKVTLVFPYLTQNYLDKVKKMLEFVNLHNDIFCEVVFNDWGLFYYIRKNYSNIKLVLGRLLTKQKSDPMVHSIVYSKQNILASKNNVFVPKQISQETKKYFTQTLINSKIFQNFMIKNNIIRIELDNVNWNMKINLPKQIKISIYYPYIKITTTRHCDFLNMTYKNCCLKKCKELNIKLKKYIADFNYIIIENSVNYKNTKLPLVKELEKNNIDRIIINE